MRIENLLIITVLLVLFSGIAFALEDNYDGYDDSPPMPGNDFGDDYYDEGPDFGLKGPDFGIFDMSIADPEYVGQEKIIENMTAAYNWISLNSARFADGCKNDKDSLVLEMSTVISQSQEASDVCDMLSEELVLCDPELFCSRFSGGQIPLPPNTKKAMKKLGYDPETITVEEITKEIVIEICMAEQSPEIEERKAMMEEMKASIREQIPEFRQKCEEMYQWKDQDKGIDIRLPDFGGYGGPRGGCNEEDKPDCGPNGWPECYGDYWDCKMGSAPQDYCREDDKPRCPDGEVLECRGNMWNCMRYDNVNNQNIVVDNTNGDGARECQGEPPRCANDAKPYCEYGGWMCPEETDDTLRECPGQAPRCANDAGAYCENGNWMCPEQPYEEPRDDPYQEPPIEEPYEEPKDEPYEEPPAEEPAPEVTTAPIFINTMTGFITAITNIFLEDKVICGDNICGEGEEDGICPRDCPVQDNKNNYNNYNDQGYNDPNQNNYNEPYQNNTQQNQNNQMMGPSPEMLCEMTDDEIVETYTKDMMRGMPQEEEMELKCRMESSRILSEMNKYKFEIARCKADVALDCEAKNQAVTNCYEMQENPEEIAGKMVNNMCRRFGVSEAGNRERELFEIANKWYDEDPAFANQLGDTAENTSEDRKELDLFSYMLGNGDYARKLKERSQKLDEARQRLIEKGVDDPETLSILDQQATELENEANRFGNIFDITRIGYMFNN